MRCQLNPWQPSRSAGIGPPPYRALSASNRYTNRDTHAFARSGTTGGTHFVLAALLNQSSTDSRIGGAQVKRTASKGAKISGFHGWWSLRASGPTEGCPPAS
jgi:hypothetical protein